MNSDDQGNLSDEQRRALLEEIRRRAEEVELKRIEEEERESKAKSAAAAEPPKAPSAFPVPPPADKPAKPQPGDTQRIAILHERLEIALDRKKVDRATSILAELRSIAPDLPDLKELEGRLEGLKQAPVEVPLPPPPPPPPPPEPAAPKRASESQRQPTQKPEVRPPAAPARKKEVRKSIPELLEEANALYQQEKYARSEELVADILAKEPDNEEALNLQEQIVRAKEIVELIKQEEARRKAEEAAAFPQVTREEPPPVISHDEKEVWGAQQTRPAADDGLELPPQEKGPVGPPKRPITKRVAERVSDIRIPWKAIGAAVLVLAAAIAGYVIVQYFRSAVARPEGSIIVLPPAVPSGDAGLTAIAEGTAEDLMADLATVSDLRVVGPRTAFSYASSPASPSRIARSVGASHYLVSTFQQVAERLVIQTNLFDTLSTSALWVSRYEASLRELPAVRLEMARKIVAAMKLNLDPERAGLLGRIPTAEPTAYEAYVRGKIMLRLGGADSAAAAASLQSRAVQADSGFPDAQAALAWASLLIYEQVPSPNAQSLTIVLTRVQHALQLGWRGAEPFRSWGMVEFYRGDCAKAVERLENAVRIAPSDPEAQRRLALVRLVHAQYEPALKAAEDAISLDPNNISSHVTLGAVHQFLGQYVFASVSEAEDSRLHLSEALKSYEIAGRYADNRSQFTSGLYADLLVFLQQHRRAEEILTDRVARERESYVDYYRLARVKQASGQPKGAWEADLQRAKTLVQARIRLDPAAAEAHAYLALIHTRLGEFKEALAASKQARTLAPANVEVLYATARMYTLQRDKAQAIEALGRALRARYEIQSVLDMDFYNLRSEKSLLAALNR